MNRFLAVYMGTTAALEEAAWKEMDEEVRKAHVASGVEAWNAWGQAHGAAIVNQGGPLGKTRRASREGITDVRNAMTGYVLVEAESLEAAAQMFANHPHFTVFPGDSVEIMECLPLPEH